MTDEPQLTAAEWHRKQAIDLFNFTWTLIDKPDRTSDDDLMINVTHASRYHWGIAGDVVNYLRSDWQIARVYQQFQEELAAGPWFDDVAHRAE